MHISLCANYVIFLPHANIYFIPQPMSLFYYTWHKLYVQSESNKVNYKLFFIFSTFSNRHYFPPKSCCDGLISIYSTWNFDRPSTVLWRVESVNEGELVKNEEEDIVRDVDDDKRYTRADTLQYYM